MKKKILSLTIAAAMMMTCMAGCGEKDTDTTSENTTGTTEAATEGNDTSEGTDTTEGGSETGAADLSGELTVLTHKTDLVNTVMPEYAKKFNETYPNVKISFEAMESYENDVSTRLSTGDYGDVFMIPNTIPVAEFGDFLEPLGTLEELSQNYDEKYLNDKQSGGIVYGLPSCVNVSNGIVYNKAVFKAAGIETMPKTPDEFIEALQKIKDNTEAIPLYTNTHNDWCLAQWEGCVSPASGDSTYLNDQMCNDPEPFSEGKPAYTVYKIMYDAVEKGLVESDPFTTEWDNSKIMMAKGEIGCMVLGSWAVSQIQGAASDTGFNPEDISYMPFPISNASGEVVVGVSPDYQYGINVHSENKDAARAFVDFMVNESGYAESQGGISIVKGADFPSTLADFADCEFQVDSPAQPENDGKWDAVHNESELGLWNGTTQVEIVEAAFGNVDKSFDDIMGEWNEKWSTALETVNADWQK